ncbi:DNA ligase [subsurface metagenome]
MKIEEMTSEKLSKISDNELYSLRLRFIQLFNKHFKNNNRQEFGNLEKNSFLDQYGLLLREMNNRGMAHSVQSIDRVLFRKNVYGLNISFLGDVVKVSDYVSIGGGFVKSPKDANDLDLIIREDEGNRDEGLELKLSRLMQKQIEKECHFVYNKTGAHSTYIPLFDLVLRSKSKINRVEVREDYSKSEELEKGVKPAFGSPGGKKFLARTIVSYIPEHKTYVEPFIGGGAVLFAKEPSESEVINDLDKEIAFAYRFIKRITDEDISKLKKRKQTFSRNWFYRLKDSKPISNIERFYKFIYLRSYSFGQTGTSTVSSEEKIGTSTLEHKLNRYPKVKDRLKGVKIENKDFRKVLKNYDSEDTFFYLDPPYPEQQGEFKTTLQVRDFELAIEGLKAKWILSMPKKKQDFKLAKKYNYKIVGVERTLNQATGERHIDKELLISNFPFKKQNIYLAKSDEEYYEGLDEWKQDFIYDFAEMAKNLEGKTILDLGCGTGRVMQALINSDYYNYQVDGIDNNDIALGMCKKKGLAVKKLDLEEGKLPHTDNFFCNVIGLHILEHLKEPGKIIKEAIRVSSNKVIFISPLGKRLDPTHKQEFIEVDDFKALFDKDAEIKMVDHGDNTVIAIIKVAKIKKADNLKPFGTFIPPKPTMAKITEAFTYSQIESWAKDRFPLDVEEKLNGFRCVAEKLGDKLRLKTEGDKERTKQLKELAEGLEKVPDDFILDFSLGIDRDGKALPRIKLMTLMSDEPVLEEKDIIKATIFDLPYWKEDLHNKPLKERRELLEKFYNKYLKGDPHFALTNFIIVKNGKELEAQFKKLSKLPQSEGIMVKDLNSIWDTDGSITGWAKIKIEAEIKVIAIKKIPNKAGGYNYHCGLLPGDSKFTNLIEFKDKKYIDLGKTFNTKINANVGDILTIGIEEIIPSDDELQWLGPRVLDIDKDRKEPYFANQVIGIAERANILQKAQHKRTECMNCSKPPVYEVLWAEGMAHAWFCKKHFKEWVGPDCEEHSGGFSDIDSVKEAEGGIAAKKFGDNKNPNIRDELKREFSKAEEGGIDYVIGDTGKGVLQLHIMGIEEDKIPGLKKISAEAVRSRANPTKLKMLLKGAIGEQGAHIDLRMVRKGDDYFEGGEIMIGNLTGLDKLKKLDIGGKLRFGWKVPRKEEPEAETIRGPVSWMKAGRNKIEIFPPGEVGATANKYGAMLLIDDFDFKAIEPQDDHAKKFEFKGNKLIPEGTYLMAYVPVTAAGKRGERVWMISKLKEETKKFRKFMPIFDVSKKEDEHIVAGVVYSPDEVDSQGDMATEEEIRKAAYRFMEEVQKFKVNHEGKNVDVKVLEIYIAPQNLEIAGQKVKKGSWVLVVRILDEGIWKKIKSGELSGFSLAGRAHGVAA